MSAYELQRCLFDHLAARQRAAGGERPAVDTAGYELTTAERAALVEQDVAAFRDLGVHPVLINAFCRANGWKRADYRVLFRDDQRTAAGGGARWQNS